MSLSEIARKLGSWEPGRLASVGADIQVKRLTLSEMDEYDRIQESCSTGSGQNRQVSNLPKLAWSIVSKWIKDSEGLPLAGKDTVEDAKEWPSTLVVEVMREFGRVNTGAPDPN